jgi:hypothetical protein
MSGELEYIDLIMSPNVELAFSMANCNVVKSTYLFTNDLSVFAALSVAPPPELLKYSIPLTVISDSFVATILIV